MSKAKAGQDNVITVNRKARYDYHLEQFFEAGICLQGWEVKSLRAGKGQIIDGYVVLRQGEAYLLNVNITPLGTVSTHFTPNAARTRKLLLKRKELNKLIGLSERSGWSMIPLDLHWLHNRVKLNFALGKGKKAYDKREAEKEKTWRKEQLLLRKLK